MSKWCCALWFLLLPLQISSIYGFQKFVTITFKNVCCLVYEKSSSVSKCVGIQCLSPLSCFILLIKLRRVLYALLDYYQCRFHHHRSRRHYHHQTFLYSSVLLGKNKTSFLITVSSARLVLLHWNTVLLFAFWRNIDLYTKRNAFGKCVVSRLEKQFAWV